MRTRLTVLGLLAAAGLAVGSLSFRYAGFRGEVFIEIPKGTGARAVARRLADAKALRFPWQFLLARALRPRAKLQAGEYRFARPVSTWEVFDRLARGDVFYYELVVPEGHSMFDIAHSAASLGLIPQDDFLRAARDPSSIRDLAPQAPTLEGYLFPSTYRLTCHTTAPQLCRQMTDQFRRVWKEHGVGDVHRVVTLASLVEKETAVAAERPLVASVFLNRLEIGMRLDCDPTAIYAALLERRFQGIIHRSDLDSGNPYNTYQHAGLPPGPISNPGLDSIQAALHPADTRYLYFVAKPGTSGLHEFSRELASHQKAVARYRRANHRPKYSSAPQRLAR